MTNDQPKILNEPEFVHQVAGTPVSIRMDKDFRPFMWMCFKTMGFEPHDIQYETADWLATSSDRVVFSCMREFGKTIIIASYMAWKLDLDNNYLFIVQCANRDKAESIISLLKQILSSTPELQYLAPDNSVINSATKFNVMTKTSVTRDCSVSAYGAASEITGAHVHEVIADDLETRENSLTDLRRERILELVREYEDLLMAGSEEHPVKTRVIIVGTPQTMESLYFALAAGGYEMFRLPSRYPDLDNPHIDTLAPFLMKRLLDKDDKEAVPWGPTYPERKSEEYLARKQMLQGDPRFYLQELLDTSLSDEQLYPLKLRNLIVYDSDIDMFPTKLHWSNMEQHKLMIPTAGLRGTDYYYGPADISGNYTEFTQRVMWVDPSGSGSDEVSWTVGLGIPGYIYIPIVSGEVDAFSELTLKKIAMTALKYKVHTVLVEPNYGGGAYRRLLQPVFDKLGVKAKLDDDKYSTGQKEARILDTLIPVTGSHKIVISTDVARDAVWGYQYTHLNYTKGSLPHDDRIESTWGVINAMMNLVSYESLEDSVDHQMEAKMKNIREYLGEDWFSDPDSGGLSGYGMNSLGL